MIRNTGDGSSAPPALRVHLCVGAFRYLPAWSAMPRGEGRAFYEAIRTAGFTGAQAADPAICRELNMPFDVFGNVQQVGEADRVAAEAKDAGAACVTLFVGSSLDDDDQIDRMVEDVVATSERRNFPLYIETHRATITQDIWRTVRFVKKFPEVRFNGDFSHWYTGHEMTVGDIAKKWEFMAPVFDRVRYVHGRIGNSGSIQVDVGDGKHQVNVDHFREMWTRSFAGFLRTAGNGDYITFTPELLWPSMGYARVFKNAAGEPVEECDRWQQAIVLGQFARECFAEAQKRTA